MLKPKFEGTINTFNKLDSVGLKGQVVMYATGVDTMSIATSGVGDGLLAQNVIDFDAQYQPGYRNLAKTDANIGDYVGVYQDGGVYYTNIFVGAVTRGQSLYSNASGYLQYFATTAGKQIAKAESDGTSDNAGDSNSVFIRVKLTV